MRPLPSTRPDRCTGARFADVVERGWSVRCVPSSTGLCRTICSGEMAQDEQIVRWRSV